jgi:hypothetical protein
VLVCHDEIVVECNIEQAVNVKVWSEKAMIEGVDAVPNSKVEVNVPIEVEARIARSWAEGRYPHVHAATRGGEVRRSCHDEPGLSRTAYCVWQP